MSPGRLLTFCCSTAVSRGLLSSHPHKTGNSSVSLPEQSVLSKALFAQSCLSVSFIFLFGKQRIRLFCLRIKLSGLFHFLCNMKTIILFILRPYYLCSSITNTTTSFDWLLFNWTQLKLNKGKYALETHFCVFFIYYDHLFFILSCFKNDTIIYKYVFIYIYFFVYIYTYCVCAK